MNLPTWLTSIRLFLVVIILGLFFWPYENVGTLTFLGNAINTVYVIIFIVFVVASLTDFLDGYLARKLKQITVLGTFLDSIADKVLTNATMIALAFPFAWLPSTQMTIPLLLVIVMVSRDLLMDALRTLAMSKQKVLSANLFGKIKTFMQMVMIPLVLLNNSPFSFLEPTVNLTLVFIYITTIMSLVSFGIYVIQNRNIFTS
jgi:CDP-diacylglycerol--glycerol-3-phosphate 3-phosphatidyltransferase